MRILIVDDNPRRYQRLLSKLTSAGIDRNDIVIVMSANDAREALEHTAFELMILDIIIPLRSEDDPSQAHSIDLLQEILEFGDLHRPGQIVGLSASEEATLSASPYFTDHLWTVIKYEETSDGWLSQIENCVLYLQNGAVKASTTEPADLVVICALEDPELRALLELPWNWSVALPLDDVTFVHEGHFSSSQRQIRVVAAAATRMGMVASTLLSAKLVEKFRPKVIAMTGICAGIRGKANIGDVLLADPSWDWQSGKRIVDGDKAGFAMAPHQLAIDSSIRSKFEQLRSNRAAFTQIASDWEGAPCIPKLIIGPVASGSAVLADGSIAESVRQQHKDLCGIEMEAYGLYAAVSMAGANKPFAFSIKSVCDFADPTKADDFQRYAAFVSARTLGVFMLTFASALF